MSRVRDNISHNQSVRKELSRPGIPISKLLYTDFREEGIVIRGRHFVRVHTRRRKIKKNDRAFLLHARLSNVYYNDSRSTTIYPVSIYFYEWYDKNSRFIFIHEIVQIDRSSAISIACLYTSVATDANTKMETMDSIFTVTSRNIQRMISIRNRWEKRRVKNKTKKKKEKKTKELFYYRKS